jgi:hypothetical protein
MFDSVKVGMTRQEAEHFLGEPQDALDDHAYYGSSPRIEKWQSPQSMHRIVVRYREGRVAEKEYFEDQARPWLRRSAAAFWQTATNVFR